MVANRIVILCGAVLLSALVYSETRVQAGQQPAAALYSTAQAKRGGDLYQAQCAMCHGAGLKGQGPIPALSGDTFVAVYSGQPASALYDKVQGQMPPNNPGSLTPAQATDVMAYLLSANQYAAGDVDLPADRSKLKTIQLPKP